MNKKFLKVLSALTLLLMVTGCFSVFAVSTSAAVVAWDGETLDYSWYYDDGELVDAGDSASNPYKIRNGAQLAALATLVNGDYKPSKVGEAAASNEPKTFKLAYFAQTNDIDMGNQVMSPIGVDDAFRGIFDGQGFTISNIKQTGDNNSGLFGYVHTNAVIKNVNIKTSSFTANSNAGAVVGCATSKVLISNCHVDAATTVTSKGGNAGAIIGYCHDLTSETVTVEYCTTAASVSVDNVSSEVRVGGIVGFIDSNTGKATDLVIRNCVNKGTVTGFTQSANQTCVGGIIGKGSLLDGAKITIDHCYNTGALNANTDQDNGYKFVGGIVGFIHQDDGSGVHSVTACFANSVHTVVNAEKKYDFGVFSNIAGTYTLTAKDLYSVGSLEAVPSGNASFVGCGKVAADTDAITVDNVSTTVKAQMEAIDNAILAVKVTPPAPEGEPTTTTEGTSETSAPVKETEEKPGETKTNEPETVTTNSTEEQSTEEGGCGSVIGGLAILPAVLMGVAVVSKKRK